MNEKKQYTWEEKIDSLVKLAKAAGTYIDVEIEDPDTDGHKEARRKVKEAYEEFCEWRHEEPYVVDEIKELLGEPKEYLDVYTGVRLIVNHDTPEYPEHPLITIICPPDNTLSIEQINEAMQRLQSSAGLSPQHRMPPLQWNT